MNWIKHPVILENEWVKLVPLESAHIEELIRISRSPDIWQYLSLDGINEDEFRNDLKSALLRRANGEEYTFTIFDNKTGRMIGSTRFLGLFPLHRKLEIGWTWYIPEYWGTGHNAACKLLLMTYAFEILKCIRVQYQVNNQNERSKAAVLKLGAKFEGVLRNDRIRYTGMIRDTAMFSIIHPEWPEVKEKLMKRCSMLDA